MDAAGDNRTEDTMRSFHRTTMINFLHNCTCDRNGYVHCTIKAVMAADYGHGERLTRDEAREIARDNREAARAAFAALDRWQAENAR
jgi:hypothetical protein